MRTVEGMPLGCLLSSPKVSLQSASSMVEEILALAYVCVQVRLDAGEV